MEKDIIPCINCITLAICKQYSKSSYTHSTLTIFSNLATKCSLINKYGRVRSNSVHCFDYIRTMYVMNFLQTGIINYD